MAESRAPSDDVPGTGPAAAAVLSALAHALNNPLGSIVLAAGLLREQPDAAIIEELADAIEADALRAAAIVADLRDLGASSSAGRVVVVDAVRLVEDAAPGRVHAAQGPRVAVAIDRSKVLLVLQRLLDESPLAQLSVAAVADGGRVIVTIETDATAGDVGSRTTLARTIADLVIRQQGGALEPIAGGWRLSLPAAATPSHVGREALIIDDNEAMTSLLTLLLQHGGWTVSTAADADEAVRLLEAGDPSVVLVDVHLADRSGIEVADMIEQARPDLAGRIAFLTGDRTAELGDRPALYKPFRWADVEALLARLVGPGHAAPGSDAPG